MAAGAAKRGRGKIRTGCRQSVPSAGRLEEASNLLSEDPLTTHAAAEPAVAQRSAPQVPDTIQNLVCTVRERALQPRRNPRVVAVTSMEPYFAFGRQG